MTDRGRPPRQATLPNFTPPRVEELTAPPKIGNWYLVPSAYRGDLLLPVRLPIHADAGTEIDHAHIDVRFLSARSARREAATGHGCFRFSPRVEERPMQCVRRDVWRGRVGAQVAADFIYVAPAEGKAVRREGRLFCPHKGADITACPRMPSGHVACPLHGMLLSIEDE